MVVSWWIAAFLRSANNQEGKPWQEGESPPFFFRTQLMLNSHLKVQKKLFGYIINKYSKRSYRAIVCYKIRHCHTKNVYSTTTFGIYSI